MLIIYDDICGMDATGRIPESVIAECRYALSALGTLLNRDGFRVKDITRFVYAIRDGESLLACQTVLSGWFDGLSPVMTMRSQSHFPHQRQRLLFAASVQRFESPSESA